MTRDEMVAALEESGVAVDRRWSNKTLRAKIDGPPRPLAVRCIVANVWTNGEPRKLRFGEVGAVPPSDIDALQGKVEIL